MTNLIVAGWFFLFMLPLFLFTPDRPDEGLPIGQAIREVEHSSQDRGTILRQPNIRRFLIARMIFTDGSVTLFAMGATYAAIRHGMDLTQIIMFGILLNVTAGIGAFAFGYLDDRFGAKRVIRLADRPAGARGAGPDGPLLAARCSRDHSLHRLRGGAGDLRRPGAGCRSLVHGPDRAG